MITVRPIHDGIFAVSTNYDEWHDDCEPPRPTNCKSCLHWISGKAYVCSTCERDFCNPACASSERHRCEGRQTALEKLPSTESHQKRMASALAYQERQQALVQTLTDEGRLEKHQRKMALQIAANKRWRAKKRI